MTNENKFRDLVKKMAVDLRQARARIDELEERDHEPIAVVGIGCRFPGGADNPQAFWDLLSEERETLGGFPTDRDWDLAGLFAADPDTPGSTYVRSASFLEGAGDFDPAFFGINPREALAMDPQHRLVMETAWEGLERAGIPPATLHATPTGVFVGMVGQTYGPPIQDSSAELIGYRMLGSMPAVAAGRLSYTLGLEGPAVTVDTACSSSLVALDLAMRSLRTGESSLALAGGATVYTDTSSWVSFSGHGALAPDGRCKAFSDDADGTGWGEAAGMLVLERLSDARRAGHRVLAVLRGGAIGQDGASSGLTAPSGPAQERVIRQALADARLAPAEVDAVEAHGTGTKLGDPIEAHALLSTYGRDRVGDPLWLGSLKSNIGHTGAAAGVSGVIKMIMAIHNGVLPRTLHVDEPTSHVDWKSGAVELLTDARPWPETGRPRRAGVSSFGASGTNAHIIVEQAPHEEPVPAEAAVLGTAQSRSVEIRASGSAHRRPVPWVLSAHTPDALGAQAERLLELVESDPALDPADLGWSLATTRAALTHRAAVVGSDRATLLTRLRALSANSKGTNGPGTTKEPGVVQGRATEGKTVFVYPGQGSQWPAMARELMDSEPVFADQITACEAALAPHVDWSLTDTLRGRENAPPLERPDVVPQVLWAVMIALTALWRSRGIHPDAVVGHSQGEVAAAYVAGALSLEDSAKVIALRSRAVGELVGNGAMAVLARDEATVRGHLAEFGDLHVAVVNSPGSTVVGGDHMAVDQIVAAYEAEGVRARVFSANVVSHVPRTEQVREGLLDALADIMPAKPRIPLYSPVTGTVLDRPTDAAYWYAGLSRPVLFQKATESLLANGHTVFVEVSAHPVLSVPVQETSSENPSRAVSVPTLRRDEGGPERFLAALAEAHMGGATPDWGAVFDGSRRTVDLPTYAFQHQRFWITGTQGAGDVASAGLETEQHPLLGAAVPLADTGATLFTGRVSRGTHPWLADHASGETVLLPGTAFLELALNTGERLGSPHVEEIVVRAPLLLPEQGAVQLQVKVDLPDEEGRRSFGVYSRQASAAGAPDLGERPWTHHALGTLAAEPDRSAEDLTVWPPPGATPVATADLYERMGGIGYTYGPAFRGLTAAWLVGEDVYAEIDLPEPQRDDAARFGLHPALADAAQHAIGCAPWMPGDGVRLPFSWSGVTLHTVGATRLRVRVRATGEDEVAMLLADTTGAAVATIDSLVLRAPSDTPEPAVESDDLFHVEWVVTAAAPAEERQVWAVLGEDILDTAAAFTASGHTVRAYADADALVRALDGGAPVPDQILLPYLSRPAEPAPVHVHTVIKHAVAQTQLLLADERVGTARLVLLTHRAVAAGSGEDVPDLVHAPLWGFARAAEREHPGRFAIVDTDDPGRTTPLLVTVLTGGEHQTVIRAGTVLGPRLARTERDRSQGSEHDPGQGSGLARAGIPASGHAGDPAPVSFGDGTVLVTGATGALGGEIARHLVDRYGARDLLLVSRSGPDAKGAAELESSLTSRGASVTLAACDTADRDQLASVLSRHRVTAVVHVAATLDDGLLTSLTPEGVDHVLRPKVDAAWHLHELTSGLAAFVLFSSAAGTLGSPGQTDYSAANAFVDMLAHHRRAHGLPAVSLSWGMWEQRGENTAKLGDSDIGRYARLGLAGPVTTDHGLALFDAALASTDHPHLLPVPMDLAAARARAARTGEVSTMLRGLIRPPRRRAGSGGPATGELRRTLAGTPEEQRQNVLLSLVLARTAEVLGQTGADSVIEDAPFLEMGFDSLTAIELRNHLGAATALRLPAGLAFAHPTPLALAAYLTAELTETLADERTRERIPSPGSAQPADHGLVQLFVDTCEQGKVAQGLDLIWAASQVRPTFSGPHDIHAPRVPVRLSKEGAGAKLICLPSVLMISGVQEYARFANGVRGRREVDVIPQPGFADGDPLPESVAAVTEVLADAVVECASGRPFVLVGRSSGGWVSHAVVELLERRGHAPRATALMDTPHPTDLATLPTLETGVVERGEMLGIMDGVRLTAMGAYLRLFRDWRPGPIETPTVVLRPEEPTFDRTGTAVPPFTWDLPHDVLRVSGDHFTMLEGHVDVVGRALHDWLEERGL